MEAPKHAAGRPMREHVQSRGKAVDVARRVGTSARPGDCGKSDKGRSLLAFGAQERRSRDVAEIVVARKGAVCTSSASVDSSLGNLHAFSQSRVFTMSRVGASICRQAYPLMVKTSNLLAKDKVLEKGRAALAGLEAVLVFYRTAGIRGQITFAVVHVIPGDMVARSDSVGPGGEALGIRKGALCIREAGKGQRSRNERRAHHVESRRQGVWNSAQARPTPSAPRESRRSYIHGHRHPFTAAGSGPGPERDIARVGQACLGKYRVSVTR